MQQIVKKFQTVRIVFDHSARFVRDTCFNLWKSLLRRNQFFLMLCRRRRLRYILRQWKKHNDEVVHQASEDDSDIVQHHEKLTAKASNGKRHVHMFEGDPTTISPDSKTPGGGGATGRHSKKAGGSLPGSRRPSLDDIMKAKKTSPLKSHKSMMNVNDAVGSPSTPAAAAIGPPPGSAAGKATISPPLKRGGSQKNALNINNGNNDAITASDLRISHTGKKTLSKKASFSDLSPEKEATPVGSKPAPLLKRGSASNFVLRSDNTMREVTDLEKSTRSMKSNESKKFTIAELNASRRNISQKSFKFSQSLSDFKFVSSLLILVHY